MSWALLKEYAPKFNRLKQNSLHANERPSGTWNKPDSLTSDIIALNNGNSELRREIERLRSNVTPQITIPYQPPIFMDLVRVKLKKENENLAILYCEFYNILYNEQYSQYYNVHYTYVYCFYV